MKRVLIVGNINNIHIQKLNEYLDEINEGDVQVDLFHLGYNIAEKIDNAVQIQRQFPSRLYKISALESLLLLVDFYFSFKKVQDKYHLINLQYLTYHSFFVLPLYKLKGKKLMISPWGSDVNRIHGFKKFLFQRIYHTADWVSVPDVEFRKIVQNKFQVPQEKIIDVAFGSDMIDFILTRKHISKESSKRELGFQDNFLITCGYNRSSAQNHKVMIDSIIQSKGYLPENTLLVFLLTYGTGYDLSFYFEKLNQNDIKYITYEKFLEKEDLFNIENATDVFIHIQDTDANSAFMQEFLLCNALVINGGWLKYNHLEKKGSPYIKVDDKTVESLSLTFRQTLNKELDINSSYAQTVIADFAWSSQIKKWYSFLKDLKV